MTARLGAIGRLIIRSSEHVYGLGVAIAGGLAIAVGEAVYGEETRTFLHPGGISESWPIWVSSASALLGGLMGGYLCWRELVPHAPLTMVRSFLVAASSTGSSLVIGVLVGIGGVMVIGLANGLFEYGSFPSALPFLAATFLAGLIVAPVYAVSFFAVPFSVLVLLWTLLWRWACNQLGNKPALPTDAAP